MSVLLQISDPHFGTEQEPVVAGLLDLIRTARPSLVIVSGDITQRARRSQFAAARAFLDEIDTPRLVVPGNHDIPLYNLVARILYPYAGYRRAFGDELEPTHQSSSLLVIGLNTTRPRRHKDGEVSSEQIERVSQLLRRATPEQLRIVVTHQPVHVIRDKDVSNLLHGHEAAVRAWSAAGADIFMGGHIHLPYMRPLSERFRDLPRETWAIQAGTATSRRVRDGVPNSVNLLHYPGDDANSCKVERWDFHQDSGKFAASANVDIQLDRSTSKPAGLRSLEKTS
jgi:3',5'-cyclic AMP phosphodiesterase CpdA